MTNSKRREGTALIVALWVIILMSLLIASFAFEMHVEAEVISYYRKRIKAQALAQSGVELARVFVAKMAEATEDEFGLDEAAEQLAVGSLNLSRGVAIRGLERELGEGRFTLSIEPEEGRRNINNLDDIDWEEILDQANIPQDRWPELIDCFLDWTDEDDLHRLNGAESDDPFYVERGYAPKNGPLDTVDELRLIKGFDDEVVFGSPPGTDPLDAITGIASWLTTWSHGKVNVNTASREVLMTLRGIEEWVIDAIIEGRKGLDGEEGTRDDGFETVDEVIGQTGMDASLRDKIAVRDVQYLRITSIGEVYGVKSVVWCVMRVESKQVIPVFWREEQL